MLARVTEESKLSVSIGADSNVSNTPALPTPLRKTPSSKSIIHRLSESTSLEDKLKAQAYIAQQSLPLVDLIAQQLPAISEGGPNYERVVKLTSAHLLENALAVFQTAMQRGLKPENTVAVSKCYSNHLPVSEALRNIGMKVTVQNSIWSAEDGFEDTYEFSCAEACADFDKLLKPDSLPIIFDDGGCLVKLFAKSTLPNRALMKYAVMIEQTSSGATTFDSKCATFPKVNMYNSAIKEAECALVAACSIERIKVQVNEFVAEENKKFEGDDPSTLSKRYKRFEDSSIGVIGLGKLGMRVAKELVKNQVTELRVFDCNSSQIEKATALGIPFVRSADYDSIDEKSSLPCTQIEGTDDASKVFAHSDLVIGVTGNPIIQQGYEAKTLVSKPVIACSLSSRQADFLHWLTYAHKLNCKTASQRGESHNPEIDFATPLILKNGYAGKLAFLRHGTPLTFDNGPHALPAHHAQLTRALIVASQLEAVEIAIDKETTEKSGKKFINTDYKLSPLWQLFIFKNFLQLLPKEEIDYFYSEEEIAKWTNIQSIATLSAGNTYLPFERKTRVWLDAWLKENNLTESVDQWLSQTQAATAAKRDPSPNRRGERSASPATRGSMATDRIFRNNASARGNTSSRYSADSTVNTPIINNVANTLAANLSTEHRYTGAGPGPNMRG